MLIEFSYDEHDRRAAINGWPTWPNRVRWECRDCGGLHAEPSPRCETCDRELGGG